MIAPLAGTPSERAGIQRGDEIVSIDGKVVEPSGNIDGIVGRLRGKPKTRVLVGLFRPATQETRKRTTATAEVERTSSLVTVVCSPTPPSVPRRRAQRTSVARKASPSAAVLGA